jgi:hypothetical protein
MAKFEAHITFDRADADKVRQLANVYPRWKYSQFDADPVMGDKPYTYLTAYAVDSASLKHEMHFIVEDAKEHGAVALRQKVERIIYDTKTNVDEITPVIGGRD